MAGYRVSVARSARKELEAIDRGMALRIISRLELLAQVPRPPGCVKLEGGRDLWRIRVGDYRVVYQVDDSELTVDVKIVRHRCDAYRF